MRAHDDATALLMAARMLITDRSAWTRGTFATTKHGRTIGPTETPACRFCAQGALMATHDQARNSYFYAEERLRKAMGVWNVPTFNDSRTHAEVLAAFDAVIEQEQA